MPASAVWRQSRFDDAARIRPGAPSAPAQRGRGASVRERACRLLASSGVEAAVRGELELALAMGDEEN